MKRILITGACGFIGHHFVEHTFKNTDWEIVALDRLDGAATYGRFTDMDTWDIYKSRIKFVWHDLKAPINEFIKREIGHIDYIVHLAASSHVDRSITFPMEFVMDNVVGTCNLLEYARNLDYKLEKIVYFSTDEVFGPAPEGTDYKEWDRYRSSNPYSASKAGGEELAIAYENTYKLPIIITHCMNVFGERQHPEKFLPLVVKKILYDEEILIHSDETKTKSGSRFYIHARDVADAVIHILKSETQNGDKFNIRGYREVENLELAQLVSKYIGKPMRYQMINFHGSRPGHDLRYALDGEKLKEMGWQPAQPFEVRLEKTVRWMIAHPKWLLIDHQ